MRRHTWIGTDAGRSECKDCHASVMANFDVIELCEAMLDELMHVASPSDYAGDLAARYISIIPWECPGR